MSTEETRKLEELERAIGTVDLAVRTLAKALRYYFSGARGEAVDLALEVEQAGPVLT
jgi:hypothetical protein